jgi:anti-sigma28 factor (negative regulator of flagellin synthesis)
MKINANPVIGRSVLARYGQGKPSAVRDGAAPPVKDDVMFSDDALSFSKALSRAREGAQARTAAEITHISAITSAVRQGEYRIDSAKIAESIVSGLWL